MGDLADLHELRARWHRRGAVRALGDSALSLFDLHPRPAALGVFFAADVHGLGDGVGDLRAHSAQRARRRKHCLVRGVHPGAVSAIYYPVSILPRWLQYVAWILPSSHVFEGMRTVMFQHTFPLGHFFAAAGLDVIWLAAGGAVFLLYMRQARRRGALMQMGE